MIVEPVVLPPVENGAVVFLPAGILTTCAPGFTGVGSGRSFRCVPIGEAVSDVPPRPGGNGGGGRVRTAQFIDRNRNLIDDRDEVGVSSVSRNEIPQRNITMVALVGGAAVAVFLFLRKS